MFPRRSWSMSVDLAPSIVRKCKIVLVRNLKPPYLAGNKQWTKRLPKQRRVQKEKTSGSCRAFLPHWTLKATSRRSTIFHFQYGDHSSDAILCWNLQHWVRLLHFHLVRAKRWKCFHWNDNPETMLSHICELCLYRRKRNWIISWQPLDNCKTRQTTTVTRRNDWSSTRTSETKRIWRLTWVSWIR